MNLTLTVDNLHIRRSKTFTLHIEQLRVSAKSIVCIAGPNGGGKSTFMQCIVGLLKPDSGKVIVDGTLVTNDLRATRSVIGFVPDDEDWLIQELCAKEYFDLLIRVYRDAGVRSDMRARIGELAKELSFTTFLQQLGSLSHGNKKKVQIIAGLMHEPKLIVLDEIRNGLDPLAIMSAEKIITDERKRGACIIAATHDLWWAERTSNRILLLSDGSIQANLPTKTILRKYGSVESLFLRCGQGSNEHK
jgi:ABC-2 type transport system ATP-binding protein